MKSLVVAAASAAALLAVPALAQAQDTSIYGTVGYANFAADDANLGAVQGRLGVRFGQYLGVEGEAAVGVDDDSLDTGLAPPLPTTADVELKHELGIFGVVFLPTSENVDLFARVGYVGSEIDVSAAGVSDDLSDDGWAFGVGGAFYFDGQNGVRADYTRHEYGDDVDADVWSLAYSRRF